MRRPVSVSQAAEILGISEAAVLKRVRKGQLLAVPLSGKGLMVCHESVLSRFDEPVDEEAFRRMCSNYVSVPEACGIVCVTDGMVIRMIEAGVLDGFRLNKKAWAVSRRSCEENIRQYLESPNRPGRPRVHAKARVSRRSKSQHAPGERRRKNKS